MTTRLSALTIVALAAVIASGCARAQAARTTPDGPPLDMPAPPPRDIETVNTEAPPPPPPPAAPPPQEPPRTTTPARPRPTPPREPARTEPPKVEPEPPKTPAPAPANEEPKPSSTLQTKPTGEEGDVEKAIRTTLKNATTDLNRVNYRTLNADARTQYDSVKGFIRQAEDALRQKNLVFAKTVADKAAALAAQLAGR
jgi:hypothetical protein